MRARGGERAGTGEKRRRQEERKIYFVQYIYSEEGDCQRAKTCRM
jgi:hypothetical protein